MSVLPPQPQIGSDSVVISALYVRVPMQPCLYTGSGPPPLAPARDWPSLTEEHWWVHKCKCISAYMRSDNWLIVCFHYLNKEIFYYYIRSLEQSVPNDEACYKKKRNTRGHLVYGLQGRGYHARGVYLTFMLLRSRTSYTYPMTLHALIYMTMAK